MTPAELKEIRKRWQKGNYSKADEEGFRLLTHIAEQDEELKRLKPNAKMIVDYEQLRVENARLLLRIAEAKRLFDQIITVTVTKPKQSLATRKAE